MVRATAPVSDTGTIPATTKGISRREFLYYMLGSSLALLLTEAGAGLVWYMQRYRVGPQNGIFDIDPGNLPIPRTAPRRVVEGMFWLSNPGKGLLAFNGQCPFDIVHFKWVDVNNRFECPDCGSKYRTDGTYIEGPADRGLDRLVIYVKTPHGTIKTPEDGSPVDIHGATAITVDALDLIAGQSHG